MLRNLAQERLAVGLGHPVARLDLAFGVDRVLETPLFGAHGFARGGLFDLAPRLSLGIHRLRVHAARLFPRRDAELYEAPTS